MSVHRNQEGKAARKTWRTTLSAHRTEWGVCSVQYRYESARFQRCPLLTHLPWFFPVKREGRSTQHATQYRSKGRRDDGDLDV